MSRQCVLNSYVRILFINNRMQIYSFFMKGGVFRGVFGIKTLANKQGVTYHAVFHKVCL